MINKKFILIANISALILIFLSIIFILIYYIITGTDNSEQECLDANIITSLKYSACYSENQQSMILMLSREQDNYDINQIIFSFLDKEQQQIAIRDIPKYNEIKKINITASKNPEIAKILVRINTETELCNQPKTILVKSCDDISASSNFSGNGTAEKKDIQKSDLLPGSLVKYKFGISSCVSDWKCNDWENCIEGMQKRSCFDSKNCLIQSNVPDLEKLCNSSCEESWTCSWSNCIDGYTTPECTDANNCNTNYNKPKKLSCLKKSSSSENCNPDIFCGQWSSCNINLKIIDLKNLSLIQGEQNRICRDRNSCLSPVYETKNCALKVNIYTKEVEWYGEKYLEIYNKLTDKLISRARYSSGDFPSLNLNFYFN